MTIKRKLQLNIVLLVIFSLLFFILQSVSQLLFGQVVAREFTFDKLVKSNYEISLLTRDVISYINEERPKRQWQFKYEEIGSMLHENHILTFRDSESYAAVVEHYDSIGRLYSDLLKIAEISTEEVQSELAKKRVLYVSGRITIAAQLMVDEVSRLRELFYNHYQQQFKYLNLFVFTFSVSIFITIIFLSSSFRMCVSKKEIRSFREIRCFMRCAIMSVLSNTFSSWSHTSYQYLVACD